MNIQRTTPDRLTPEMLAVWRDMQRSQPHLDSPYFRPEFTLAVATVRDDVEVAVLEDGGRPVGFWPYQRRGRTARPVGGRLSDYQGVIARPETAWDAAELLRACDLSVWQFDHLVEQQAPLERFVDGADGSPYLDLSHGFEAYRSQRVAAGGTPLKQVERKCRVIEREIGPLRLVPNANEPELLDTLFAWKSQQYVRSNATDVFSFPWTRALLDRLLTIGQRDGQRGSFGGMLSAVYAGDELLALHFGLRSDGVLHYWFPAYSTRLAEYTPGLALLLELARHSADLGLTKIDLGRGMVRYKTELMSAATPVRFGSADLRPMRRALRTGWRRTCDWVRHSPLRSAARWPGRALFRFQNWLEFRS